MHTTAQKRSFKVTFNTFDLEIVNMAVNAHLNNKGTDIAHTRTGRKVHEYINNGNQWHVLGTAQIKFIVYGLNLLQNANVDIETRTKAQDIAITLNNSIYQNINGDADDRIEWRVGDKIVMMDNTKTICAMPVGKCFIIDYISDIYVCLKGYPDSLWRKDRFKFVKGA